MSALSEGTTFGSTLCMRVKVLLFLSGVCVLGMEFAPLHSLKLGFSNPDRFGGSMMTASGIRKLVLY